MTRFCKLLGNNEYMLNFKKVEISDAPIIQEITQNGEVISCEKNIISLELYLELFFISQYNTHRFLLRKKILCEGNNPFHFPNEHSTAKRKNRINNRILSLNPLSLPLVK